MTIKNPEKNIFTRLFNEDTPIPIPVNHGEGRFIFENRNVPDVTVCEYTNSKGKKETEPL